MRNSRTGLLRRARIVTRGGCAFHLEGLLLYSSCSCWSIRRFHDARMRQVPRFPQRVETLGAVAPTLAAPVQPSPTELLQPKMAARSAPDGRGRTENGSPECSGSHVRTENDSPECSGSHVRTENDSRERSGSRVRIKNESPERSGHTFSVQQ